MIYLLLCVLSSSVIYVIFKFFERFRIDLLQAIVVNYIIAGTLGFVLSDFLNQGLTISQLTNQSWIWFAFLLGFMFITIFNLMGICSQRSGVGVTAIAVKMSVVLPVVFGLFYLKENLNFIKLTGIILAFPALYLTLRRTENSEKSKNGLILPILIFFSSGLLDIVLSYCNHAYINQNNSIIFTSSLFAMAAIFGIVFLIISLFIQKIHIRFKNIIGGIVLGIPNFFSILFIFLGLKETGWPTTIFFPINNVGIVILTAILGLIVFKDKYTKINFIGILLALVSIVLISIA